MKESKDPKWYGADEEGFFHRLLTLSEEIQKVRNTTSQSYIGVMSIEGYRKFFGLQKLKEQDGSKKEKDGGIKRRTQFNDIV